MTGDPTCLAIRIATAAGLIVLLGSSAAAAQVRTLSPSVTAAPERAASMPADSVQKSHSATRRPSVAIVTPKAGATVHGSTVTVSVRVRGFRVLNKQFQPPVTGERHVHFYLDVKTLPTTHTYPSPVHYHSISGTSYTWTGVSPGRHAFAVQLVGNDHVPLHPPVKAQVTFTVR